MTSMSFSVQPYSVQVCAGIVFVSTSTAPVSMGCLYLVHQTMWYWSEWGLSVTVSRIALYCNSMV